MRLIQLMAAVIPALTAVSFTAWAGTDDELRKKIRLFHPQMSDLDVSRVISSHRSSALISAYDQNLDGVIDAAEAIGLSDRQIRRRTAERKLAAKAATIVEPTKPPVLGAEDASPPVSEAEPKFKGVCRNSAKNPARSIELGEDGNDVITPLIRRSFTDIFLFDCPTAAADARGAEFAYTRNGVANNSIWSINGMAALSYQHFGDYGGILGYALTPFVQIERQTNSKFALRSRNTELLTGGFSGEIGIDAGSWSHYSRITGSFSSDDVNHISYSAASYEWLPVACAVNGAAVNISCPTSFGGLFIYRFHPSVLVQYDAVEGGDAVVGFSNRRDALRVGPRFLLNVRTIPRVAEMLGLGPAFAGFLNSFVFNASYHVADEVYTGKFYQFADLALTYNFDPFGFSGITFSYSRGKSEITGEKIDLMKAALVVKY